MKRKNSIKSREQNGGSNDKPNSYRENKVFPKKEEKPFSRSNEGYKRKYEENPKFKIRQLHGEEEVGEDSDDDVKSLRKTDVFDRISNKESRYNYMMLVDSGATHHAISEFEHFIPNTYHALKRRVHFGTSSLFTKQLVASFKGDIMLILPGGSNFVIHDVYHCPNLSQPLFSTWPVVQDGYRLILDKINPGLFEIESGCKVINFLTHNRGWILDGQFKKFDVIDGLLKSLRIGRTTCKNSQILSHRRMGHCFGDVQNLLHEMSQVRT